MSPRWHSGIEDYLLGLIVYLCKLDNSITQKRIVVYYSILIFIYFFIYSLYIIILRGNRATMEYQWVLCTVFDDACTQMSSLAQLVSLSLYDKITSHHLG